MLKLDSANMWESAVGTNGIRSVTESAHAATGSHVLELVLQNLQNQQYGYANLVTDNEYLAQTQRVFKHIQWADTMVVVGIGGSDLGGRAIQSALQRADSPMRVIFHGNTTDPADIEKLLREVELPNTIFNIVSKSGSTMETMAYYLYFKQLYFEREEDWSRHFVFTTDQNSILWKEALQNGIALLKIPDEIGGRYSVLTAVGLLPALAMDVNVHELWQGAQEAISATLNQKQDSVAWQIAWQQFLLNQQGVDLAVFMPYSARLDAFTSWIRQLWAESLGKDGKGIMPIQASGPADQHSQLQFYTQGKFLGSLLFLRVEDHGVSFGVERADISGMEYLEGKDFGEIINVELQATAASLRKSRKPSAVLEVERIEAESLGELFMTFELAVTFLGELLGINAFDQPGVEESKDFTSALLGHPGFSHLLSELNSD